MKKLELKTAAALNALGVAAYVFLVSLVLNNAEWIFGRMNPASNKVIAPIAFLLFFVFSALLTGSLVLGKPIMLYMDGQKKEGVKMLIYTGATLFLLLIIVLSILLLAGWIK